MNRDKLKEILDEIEYQAEDATHYLTSPEKLNDAVTKILKSCDELKKEIGTVPTKTEVKAPEPAKTISKVEVKSGDGFKHASEPTKAPEPVKK